MIETILAVAGLVVCAALLLRLSIGARRRQRLDGRVRRAAQSTQRAVRLAWRWRSSRREAARAAEAAIRRARGAPQANGHLNGHLNGHHNGSGDGSKGRPAAGPGEWHGNVFRPKSFRRRRKND